MVFSVSWWSGRFCECIAYWKTHWNACDFGRKTVTFDCVEHGRCWREAFLPPRALQQHQDRVMEGEPSPVSDLHSAANADASPTWTRACFQGDKHRVTQHCESCNNIVFIVSDGWNFSHFASWSWEDMQECLSSCWTQRWTRQNTFAFFSCYFLPLPWAFIVSLFSFLSLATSLTWAVFGLQLHTEPQLLTFPTQAKLTYEASTILTLIRELFFIHNSRRSIWMWRVTTQRFPNFLSGPPFCEYFQ